MSRAKLNKNAQKVLTVPMRNGNSHRAIVNVRHIVSSYRTYEEWKLPSYEEAPVEQKSSYRTYEEWKQQCSQKDQQ